MTAAIERNDFALKEFFTPAEVAELLMVSPVTVRLWARRGALPSVQTLGGHRRFMRDALEQFARDNNLTARIGLDGARRVLVVAEDPELRQVLTGHLARFGDQVRVDTATDGFQAGQKVVRFRPDVVLLDITTPGVGAIEVCRDLKSDPATRSIRVIAMSGQDLAEERLQAALAVGVEACLPKPLDFERLDKLLELEQERAVAR
jgi:excisionase family DNA binding protein